MRWTSQDCRGRLETFARTLRSPELRLLTLLQSRRDPAIKAFQTSPPLMSSIARLMWRYTPCRIPVQVNMEGNIAGFKDNFQALEVQCRALKVCKHSALVPTQIAVKQQDRAFSLARASQIREALTFSLLPACSSQMMSKRLYALSLLRKSTRLKKTCLPGQAACRRSCAA